MASKGSVAELACRRETGLGLASRHMTWARSVNPVATRHLGVRVCSVEIAEYYGIDVNLPLGAGKFAISDTLVRGVTDRPIDPSHRSVNNRPD